MGGMSSTWLFLTDQLVSSWFARVCKQVRNSTALDDVKQQEVTRGGALSLMSSTWLFLTDQVVSSWFARVCKQVRNSTALEDVKQQEVVRTLWIEGLTRGGALMPTHPESAQRDRGQGPAKKDMLNERHH
jgi:hypothetical protein